MPTPVETVQDFMAVFMRAWPTADTSTLRSFFSEDDVYHNVPLEPVRGRTAIEATFAQFMRIGGQVDVDIIHMMGEGPICHDRTGRSPHKSRRNNRFVADDGDHRGPRWADCRLAGLFRPQSVHVPGARGKLTIRVA